MALKLKKAGTRVFEGRAGDVVRLGMSVAKVAEEARADILTVTYNGRTVKKAPFEITIAAGELGAVVVYVSEPETQVILQEVDTEDAENRQTLAKQFFDPAGPSVTVVVRA